MATSRETRPGNLSESPLAQAGSCGSIALDIVDDIVVRVLVLVLKARV